MSPLSSLYVKMLVWKYEVDKSRHIKFWVSTVYDRDEAMICKYSFTTDSCFKIEIMRTFLSLARFLAKMKMVWARSRSVSNVSKTFDSFF